MKNIFTITIIFIILINSQLKIYCQNKTYTYNSSFSFADKNRIKHFNSHTYVASGQSFMKLNSNLEVVWEVKLSNLKINDFDIAPSNSSTLYPDQGFILVGIVATGTQDNKSFIWRVKDLDGSTQFLNYYDHIGNEGFEKILLHSNPSNSSYKYYLTGKSNYTFPSNSTNANSYRNLLYNINSDGVLNWKKYYTVQSPSAPTGQESQFFYGIVPKSNGNVLLLGSNVNIPVSTNDFNLGNIVEINGVNGNIISAKQVGGTSKNFKLYDGVNLNNGLYALTGVSRNTGSNILNSTIIITDYVNSYKSITIDNIANGFRDVVVIGNDLYAFGVDPDNVILKISNYNSNSPMLSSVTIGASTISFNNPSITFDNISNLIIVGAYFTNLIIAKIDLSLDVSNNYCIYNKSKTFSTQNENVSNLSFNTTTVVSSVMTGGNPTLGSVTRFLSCSQPCIESVDFNYTPTSCNSASFTPTVIGSSVGPFNYFWDFECDGDIDNTVQNPSYTFPPSGTYCVTLTVRDAMNVECFGTITKNITISNLNVDFSFTNTCQLANFTPIVSGGMGPYTYEWDFNCTTPIESTLQNPSFNFGTLGSKCVSLKVTDASGLCIGFIQKNIVLLDNIIPTISCPGNLILTNNPEFCYATYGGVSATDNCDINPSITCVLTGATTGTFTNVSQIQYNKGVTTVTCIATDASGNVSIPCTFTITVFDSDPPQIDCPDHITVNALPCDNSVEVTFPSPTIFDNCPMWTTSCNYMSGDFFPCGNTIVTCTVTDMGGTIASCSFNVNVICSNNCPEVTGTTLECGTTPNTYNYSVTIENPNPTSNVCTYALLLPSSQGTINSSNSVPVGSTATISGTLTPANNTIYIFNLSIVASCICQGNQPHICNLSAILDNIEVLPAPPEIDCPDDVTLFTIPDECFSVYGGVTAFDNCDPFVDITCTLTGATTGVFMNEAELPFDKGITLVECIATDSDGATSQCSYTVTVVDNQAPEIICPSDITAQVTDCSNTVLVSFPAPVVTDNCPMVQYSCSHQSNDIFNCGNTLVTCTATDMAGNTATCNFEVDVVCDCVDIVSSAIKCDETTQTYEFTINIVNNTGVGSSCTSVLSLDPAQGVILNQTTTWNGTSGTITGSIDPTLVAPFTFNLSIDSDCTCANGLSQNCTSIINYPITEVCTDFVLFDKVYGDGGENYTSTIKAFGDGIYVAGYFLDNGNEVATFTKFNAITGALLWEKKLSLNTRIRDFDYNPDNLLTSATNEETLILVGHTTPLSTGGVDVDNKSFIIGIYPNGNLRFSKLYDFTGREQLNKVERHKNPFSGFNFYTVGVKNQSSPSPIPSSWDQTMLINFDIDGNVNWIRDYTYRSFPNGDDEILRGLISLSDGSILISGNDVPRNDGLIVRIDGLTGIPIGAVDAIFANNPRPKIDFHDGLELPNGDIVLAGEWFGSNEAIIFIFSKGTFSAIGSIKLLERFPGISKFEDIHIDANGDLYAIGHIKNLQLNSVPIIVKMSYQSGVLDIIYSKYLLEGGEDFFLNPSIHVTPLKDRIYYADTRNNLGSGFGVNDILIGAFDLDLTSACSYNIAQTKSRLQISGISFPISSTLNFTPSLSIIDLIPLVYQCDDFCGPDCDVLAAFEAIPVNCYEMQFNDLSSGGTAPYTYEWDFDCTSPVESTSQNPTWTFPASGTYTICLTVTDATGACSSSIMQVVVVPPDQNNPILNCPGDITLNTDINQCYATFGGVSATDTCDTSLNIVCILTGATSGTFTNQGQIQYNKGVTVVTCTATDDSGNMVSCSFTVTVVDNQLPTIICPQNRVVNVPFCDGGANVTFGPPQISDNCPMAGYTCTRMSGDFFPCGTSTIICIVTDMAGNTNSCSFNITVNCTCTNVVSTDIQCGSLPDTYDFTIIVQNLSGNGDTCNLDLTLNPTNGIVQNQQIGWNGTQATITGTVISLLPVPSFFNFSLTSTCICPDMTQTVCTTPIILIPPCCKSAYLEDEEICKEDSIHTISLGFNGSVTSITQVNWYISFSDPCPTSVSDTTWLLYASVTSNSDTVDIFPSSLTGNHFCMYAVVSVADNPCTELITDIASYSLCDVVRCTLSSQEICYLGTPVLPAPISLTPSNTSCAYNIEWLDGSGNPISGVSNQLTYQPPALTYTGHPDSCRQDFTFAAEITGLCGPQVCYSTITLVNDAAPYGNIIMDPFEQQPFCPGEDATLRFITECHVIEGMEAWKWFETSNHLNQVPSGFATIDGMGLMNPMLHTNSLQSDIWFSVKVGDGICPPKVDTFFIDVYRNAVLTQFNAIPLDPCRTTGVNMTVNFISPDCPVIIDWYKDGIFLHSSTHATSPASFTFQYSGVTGDYSGNYHVVLRNSCCPDQFVNSIVRTIDPPMKLVLVVPCNIKGGETATLEAVVLNASGCLFEWFNENGSLLGSSSTLNVIFPGTYTVVATCGLCVLTGQYDLIECCPVSVDDSYLLNEYSIFPNPTTGQLTIQFTSNVEEDVSLKVFDILSREVSRSIIDKGRNTHNFTIEDKAGIYIVQLTDKKGSTTQRKVIKIE
ncbi:MAG: HYR domain-containing protein [Saprospiraceae bacterium]|nr:HYR domain-containing protein [Saprospiraceae bacterium]